MSYVSRLTRTSFALDKATLSSLESLGKRWAVSKAEVIRRVVRQAKEAAEREDQRPSPGQALQWLQSGGGMTVQEAVQFKAEVAQEREARRYWWET